jgi:nucleotide-binding universal stress UspA family protein
MKKILVPCDFSEPSLRGFEFAAQLAAKNQSEIFVLKASELPVAFEPGLGMPEYGFDSGLLGELEEDAKKKMAELRQRYAIGTDNVQLLTEVGAVIPTIRRIIGTKGIDTVVMGTHETGSWLDAFMGTNTEKIVRSSPVPVFAIRKPVKLDAIKNIVVPGVLPLDQYKVVRCLKEMQAFFHATLHIVFVNTPNEFYRDKEIRRVMEDFVKHYELSDYTLNVFNDLDEESGIIQFAQSVNADLIAMATHGRTGLNHLFHHNITEEVLARVDWPLWTCRME